MHRQVAIREVFITQHMLTHLQDSTTPRVSRSRSHQYTWGIKISPTLLTMVVVHICSQYRRLTTTNFIIVGDYIRQYSVATVGWFIPNLSIEKIHRRLRYRLLTILTYRIHHQSFLRLKFLRVSYHRSKTIWQRKRIAMIVIHITLPS